MHYITQQTLRIHMHSYLNTQLNVVTDARFQENIQILPQRLTHTNIAYSQISSTNVTAARPQLHETEIESIVLTSIISVIEKRAKVLRCT